MRSVKTALDFKPSPELIGTMRSPDLTRRHFIHHSAALAAFIALTGHLRAAYTKLKLGAPDWNLSEEAKPASVELAKSIGFDGVEISLGRARDHLPLSDVGLQEQF